MAYLNKKRDLIFQKIFDKASLRWLEDLSIDLDFQNKEPEKNDIERLKA